MSTGNLGIKVLELTSSGSRRQSLAVQIGIDDRILSSGMADSLPSSTLLNFDVTDLNQIVTIHVINEKEEVLGSSKHTVNELLLIQFSPKVIEVETSDPSGVVTIQFEANWTSKTRTQKYAGEPAARIQGEMAAALMGDPKTAMALHYPHRPFFARVSYYYDITKRLYAYTTSFPLISYVARVNESIANTIVLQVTRKSLYDIDEKSIVPRLERLDDKVDQAISAMITKVLKGELYIIKKKDDAVHVLSHSAKRATSSVSGAVGVGVDAVSAVHSMTMRSIKYVTYGAYSGVRNSAVYMISHIPFVEFFSFPPQINLSTESTMPAVTTNEQPQQTSPSQSERLYSNHKRVGSTRLCGFPDCSKTAKPGGFCISHGGGKKCGIDECTTSVVSRGFCVAHGGGKRCQSNGCAKSAQTGGYCWIHGGGKKCGYQGCTKRAQSGGACISHEHRTLDSTRYQWVEKVTFNIRNPASYF
uniref:Uncharacterized protein AlNc14C71G4861 n=1 Tax=Albugo laibachii Nc14 TaxID=890382 RepID=F0WDZ4_9STRA|nr:conserved hypothetical protein [Albugo laibachii Nc14]|eukprot:CCA19422.1 conserved hypothetical protein [Albugo laibachii Nc14]